MELIERLTDIKKDVRKLQRKFINSVSYQYPYNLQFFAKDGPGGEKTEDATSKKLSDARKDGKVAKNEIGYLRQ